jgi:hypothetical protein
MIGTFPSRAPKEPVFRVAFGGNPLAFRPWKTISAKTPMHGRWDDPEGNYRVLYTSATARGALRESLQYFRPALALLEKLRNLNYEPHEVNVACDSREMRLASDNRELRFAGQFECSPFEEIGTIPPSWFTTRTFSEIRVENGKCVPVCTEAALDVIYRQCGIRFNVGELLAQTGLAWTRYISRMIWRRRIYSGIEALSKFGINLRNYAFFEDRPHSNILRAKLEVVETKPLRPADPLVVAVAETLGLRVTRPPMEVSFLRVA